LVKSDRWLDEVMYEHTRWGLFVTTPEMCEGISRLVVMPEDMMKFKSIELLLMLCYLLMVCHHVGITTVRLRHDMVDDELEVIADVKPMDLELGRDAHAVDEGLVFWHIVCRTEM
jgi:hypothetical protein